MPLNEELIGNRIRNINFFRDFFKDSNNEIIVKTIKSICLAEQPTPVGTTGDLFAYRAGRQDVWNEILQIVNADIEQEQVKLKQLKEQDNG